MKKSILAFLLAFLPYLVFSENLIPVPHYRTPKNIAFGTIGGGSSHHLWIFEVLKEMNNRGHNVSFFSRGDQLHFAKKFPMINVKQVGGTTTFMHHPKLLEQFVKQTAPDVTAMNCLESCLSNYTSEFNDHLELFKSENIDLVLCDSFSISCIDAAIIRKLPVMITTTFSFFDDSSAPYINNKLFNQMEPTTKDQSLRSRIYRDYIRIPYLLRSLSYRLKDVHDFQRQLGLEPVFDSSAKRYSNIPKLINNVHGIEASRKHSSFVHMVGPILQSSYPRMNEECSSFLDSHKKVVYIAFGQHVRGSHDVTKLILQTALKLVEEGYIDGIIWAGLNKDFIPQSVQTPKHVYTHDELKQHPDVFLINWAPQYAILQHPSTSVFITHGGAASMHEALYLGVRLFVYPFFGDQPGNAISITRIGAGKYMSTNDIKYDRSAYEKFYNELKEVIVDPQRRIQKAVDQYSAYVQVRAVHAVTRAADLMEESLFASNDAGKLYYRNDVGEEIHWMKRNDYDVYLVLGVLAFIFTKAVETLARNVLFSNSRVSLQKSKLA